MLELETSAEVVEFNSNILVRNSSGWRKKKKKPILFAFRRMETSGLKHFFKLKYFSEILHLHSKTTLLQRELFLTISYTINGSPLLLTEQVFIFMLNCYALWHFCSNSDVFDNRGVPLGVVFIQPLSQTRVIQPTTHSHTFHTDRAIPLSTKLLLNITLLHFCSYKQGLWH